MRTLSFGILHSCETELPQMCSFFIMKLHHAMS